MADNNEQTRKKELKNEWKRQQKEIFEKSLPMSREIFQKLFDYLDYIAQEKECDNSLRFTEIFLMEQGIENSDAVTKWLNNNGAYCDCEILFNIEELFE